MYDNFSDDRRLLRNEKKRLAYASMDATKKNELLARQRARYREKRKNMSSSSSRTGHACVITDGMHQLKLDAIGFALPFAGW